MGHLELERTAVGLGTNGQPLSAVPPLLKHNLCKYFSYKQVLLVNIVNFVSPVKAGKSLHSTAGAPSCLRQTTAWFWLRCAHPSLRCLQHSWGCAEGACVVHGEGQSHPGTSAMGLPGLLRLQETGLQ